MQLKNNTPKQTSGFTLIEMIGVLAIIAILTALLIPKIFGVINDAKITSTLTAYNTAKSAAAANYGKWGGFRDAEGKTLTSLTGTAGDIQEDWDAELEAGQYLDGRFAVRIGNGKVGYDATNPGSRVRVIDISGLTTTSVPAAGDTGAYRLSSGTWTEPTDLAVDAIGNFLVEAVIEQVNIDDAKELNRRIDGPNDPTVTYDADTDGTDDTDADLTGRVKFASQNGNSLVTVYMYIAHR